MLQHATALALLLAVGLQAQIPKSVTSLLESLEKGDSRATERACVAIRPRLFDLAWQTLAQPEGADAWTQASRGFPSGWKGDGLAALSTESRGWSEPQRESVSARMRALAETRRALATAGASSSKLKPLVASLSGEDAADSSRLFARWWQARMVLVNAAASLRGAAEEPSGEALAAAVSSFEALGDRASEAYARSALARFAADEGRHGDARRELGRAHSLFAPAETSWPELHLASLDAEARLAIARQELQVGMTRHALGQLEKVAGLLSDLKRSESALEAQVLKAHAQWLLGDQKNALRLVTSKRRAIPRIKDWRILSRTGWAGARVLRLAGKAKEGHELIGACLKTLKAYSCPVEHTLGLRFEEASLDAVTKKPDRAIGAYKVVGMIAIAKKLPHIARLAYQNAGLVAIHRGDVRAKELLSKARSIKTGDTRVDELLDHAFDYVSGLALIHHDEEEEGFRRLLGGRTWAHGLAVTLDTMPGGADLLLLDDLEGVETGVDVLPLLHERGKVKSVTGPYYAIESTRLEEIAARLPDAKLPERVEQELTGSAEELARLRQSLSITARPLPRGRIERILARRRRALEILRSKAPLQALKLNPVPTPYGELRRRLAFQKAGLVYTHVNLTGSSLILGISGGGRWYMDSVPKKAKLHLMLKELKKNQGKSGVKPGALFDKLSPLGTTFWKRFADIFADDQVLYFATEEEWSDLGWGLMPLGTQAPTSGWDSYPFLGKRFGTAQIPAATLLRFRVDRRQPRWFRLKRLAIASRRKPKELHGIASTFAPKLAPGGDSGEELRILKSSKLSAAAKETAGFLKHGGVLLLDRRVSGVPADLGEECRPDFVIAFDLKPKQVAQWENAVLLGTLKGFLHLKSKASQPVLDAALREFLLQATRFGTLPPKAWGDVLQKWVKGELRVDGKSVPEAQRHPSLWSEIRLVLGAA